ncbi:hypothetical protein LPMP_283180 [Leishmania panamensis]|uniref:hypothetical protein n=1 Tax=Leishmania panamensis TaxID=5679 RepID=UPI0004F8D3AD|nr:hypothetical protein LPMP_283180 [Leishmania panamensis]AIN99949.1 hypothetical protein LPMP_283180 [Leishmania panamensis]
MPPPTRLNAVCDSATAVTTNLEDLQELCSRVQLLRKCVNNICNRKIPALEYSIEQFREIHLHRLLATEKGFRKDLPVQSVGLLLSSIDSLYLRTGNCTQSRWPAASRTSAAECSSTTIFAIGYSPETMVTESNLVYYSEPGDANITQRRGSCTPPSIAESMTQHPTAGTADKPAATSESKPATGGIGQTSEAFGKASPGPGAFGQASSTEGTKPAAGAFGQAPAAFGQASSTEGTKPAAGAFGQAPAAFGQASSTEGTKPAAGAFGQAPAAFGQASATGGTQSAAGVFGQAPVAFGKAPPGTSAFGQASATGGTQAAAGAFGQAPVAFGKGLPGFNAFAKAPLGLSSGSSFGAVGGGFGSESPSAGTGTASTPGFGPTSAFTNALGGAPQGSGFSSVPKSAFSGGSKANSAFGASSFTSVAANFQ